MLRKNWEKNWDKSRPATCHRAIPDLSPGRTKPGIAAIDYMLVVCGGYRKNQPKILSLIHISEPTRPY